MAFALNINDYERLAVVCKTVLGLQSTWRHKVTHHEFIVITNRHPVHDALDVIHQMDIVLRFCHTTNSRLVGYSLPRGAHFPLFHCFYESFPSGFLSDFMFRLRGEQSPPPTLTNTQKLVIIYGILAWIVAAHQKGIFFGWLNPKFVLLDDNFEPHVMNCGFLRQDAIYSDELKEATSSFLYEAPEDVKCACSDIYSFGMILFRLTNDPLLFPRKMDASKPLIQSLKAGWRPVFGHKTPSFLRT
jgi:hypothetical protein